MKFSEFIDSWLFGEDGYYQRGIKIGKEGDFYTSVSVGSFFGICIAKYIMSFNKNFEIVEIGANEGHLICDIIQGIYTFDKTKLKNFEFFIVEPFENLRKIQKTNFENKIGKEVKLNHLSSLKEAKFKNAFFISNELFDTFKCEVVDNEKMLFIENFKPIFKTASKEIVDLAKKQGIKKGEVVLELDKFLLEIYQSSKKFRFLSFDYGDFAPRDDFTLRVFSKHQVYNFFDIKNLKEFYQKSDITYNVVFKNIKDEFLKFKDVQFENFCSQSKALINFKADEILETLLKNAGENAYKNGVLQLKRLIIEMGEKFKMIEFSKGY